MNATSSPIDDVVAFIAIKMRSGGAVSIEGHLGDEAFAVSLLEHAIDAVKSQHAQIRARPVGQILLPNRDVSAKLPPTVTRPYADIPLDQRGDLPP